LLFNLVVCSFPLNLRPIVGILTQPTVPVLSEVEGANGNNASSITASYVKWVEMAGARVVPIPYNATQQQLQYYFNSVNGILMPGGMQTLNSTLPFFDASLYLFNQAIMANARGDYFPVWGTCQGFQFMNIAVSGQENEGVLSDFDSWDISYPLFFTPDSNTSRMFGSAPASVLNTFATTNCTMNWHHLGVLPSLYSTNQNLAKFFRILSTNVDRENKPFISSIEGINMPFYATQFHPEWSVFEWDPTAHVSHATETIAAMQYLADFFVGETRKNNHFFPSPAEEQSALIYNFQATYTQDTTGDTQTYYF